MHLRRLAALLLCLVPIASPAQTEIEHGVYNIHLLLHAIGKEEYTLTAAPSGYTLASHAVSSDRGTTRETTSSLTLAPSFSPIQLQQTTGATATTLTPATPSAFVGPLAMPASLQMFMVRFWKRQHEPTRLMLTRAPGVTLPVEIKLVGHDAYLSHGRMVRLARYTVSGVVFGREILWMNDSNRLAAVMTFAGGLPQEIVLDEYERLMGELFHSGVRQQMLDLADLTHQAPPIAQGTYAITGPRLVDGTGSPAIPRATVLIRDGRIVAAGPASSVAIPPGMKVIHAEGKTLLPGLWEMHSHYSGIEFGPALLARGITSDRDCGGETEFLTAVRRAIDSEHLLGPRLFLAGLIDSGGPLGFGALDVETPEEAVAAVDNYADAHFDQIKVYTQIQPDVLRAIATEAHLRGLTVTGHVPAAVTTQQGIADGMDQINHLQYVTRALRAPSSGNEPAPLDLTSQSSRDFLALLAQRQIVIDPTIGWGEMASHPKSIDPITFEPGLKAAPYPLSARFQAMGAASPDPVAAEEPRFRR